MRRQDISIGTSGWKFDDWAGSFYPLRVPPSKWLEYYSARFPIGEINSTYYRIAGHATYAGIVAKTPPEFRLFVKVHGDVTHTRTAPAESLRILLEVIAPIIEANKLLGLLAQFPTAFEFTDANLNYLRFLRDQLSGHRLCVEFRHASWDTDDAREKIRAERLTWVSPDEPQIAGLMSQALYATADCAYVRLHGRNARTWNDRSSGDRYDFNYSRAELGQIAHAILGLPDAVNRAFVLFNNCYHGQAAVNATWLQRWLTGIDEEGEPSSANGLHLFSDS
jgi:uncharacterized protein YecE (DUF72 family)